MQKKLEESARFLVKSEQEKQQQTIEANKTLVPGLMNELKSAKVGSVLVLNNNTGIRKDIDNKFSLVQIKTLAPLSVEKTGDFDLNSFDFEKAKTDEAMAKKINESLYSYIGLERKPAIIKLTELGSASIESAQIKAEIDKKLKFMDDVSALPNMAQKQQAQTDLVNYIASHRPIPGQYEYKSRFVDGLVYSLNVTPDPAAKLEIVQNKTATKPEQRTELASLDARAFNRKEA